MIDLATIVPKSRYIFVTGGVVSSLGKGLTASALAALLQARGYSVRLRKLDPYLNVDAGTMRPYEHGEVFVTDDGSETDLDLGHYERFTDVSATCKDSITAGQIYNNVINEERQGADLGATIQVIPHITNAIRRAILADDGAQDFTICEIGGTVGDIEGLPFLEAIRQFRSAYGPQCSAYVHCTLIPYIQAAREFKTKPSQHSVKELLSLGIQPDVLVCRIDQTEQTPESPTGPTESFDRKHLKKISIFCNVPLERVIPAFNNSSIYRVPQQFMGEGLDEEILSYFNLEIKPADLTPWERIDQQLEGKEGTVRIALVGKYVSHQDAYKSVYEALTHAGCKHDVRVEVCPISSEDFETKPAADLLNRIHGVLIPGGFGRRGMEGKIKAIQYVREHGLPFFGICLGMQMAVIEAARNLAGLPEADTSEEYLAGPVCPLPIVGLLEEWVSGNQLERRDASSEKGGTMRVGGYDCVITAGSRLNKCYGATQIRERHRHRYEVNIAYREQLEAAGLVFSGLSPDMKLPEVVEYPNHPWFIGVQFHPELRSRPFQPHPLFDGFIRAALDHSRLV